MPLFTDQLGRIIEVKHVPRRIISLVPSQTELLSDLGLDEEVAGITKFCIHPDQWFRSKQRVGGTKNVNIEKIKALNPDLIIANKEENVKEQIDELSQHFPVWISDVNTLTEAYSMMQSIGEITSKESEANDLVRQLQAAFTELPVPRYKHKATYLIWKDPYMTIGQDSFIHEMLAIAGYDNAFEHLNRYPAVTIKMLQEADCQILMLSSEPYPFKEKHIKELQHHLPDTKIILVDGEMFSWYGSRLLHAPLYFKMLRAQIDCML